MGGRQRSLLASAGLAVGLAVASLLGVTAPALASSPSVSAHAALGTPHFPLTGPVEQVRQLVQCGGTMYAVGTFHTVISGSSTVTRDNAFSFSATAPYKLTSWNPDVNGIVNSIAFDGSDCSKAYIGGIFTAVHGTAVHDLAAVSTSTGAVDTSFGHSAGGQVETLLVVRGHLLTGGYFTTINDSAARYFTSLSPETGQVDGFAKLPVSGTLPNAGTRVYNQQLSHSGTLDLIEGVFTSISGQHRQQIAMLNVGGSSATLTAWNSTEFYGQCSTKESFYIQAASWAPDDGTIYIADTGNKPSTGANTALCDAAAAFPSTQTTVTRKWINYTGCDSMFSTAAGDDTVYFGGHERWADNGHACNKQGAGAIPAPGMVGLSPSAGAVVFNPTRGRGYGADDMLLTGAGLWIASDNAYRTQGCAHSTNHEGICFLPDS